MTKNQTCLLCGYKNSMSVTQKESKTLVYCHNGCDSGDLYRAYCDQEGLHKDPIPARRKEPVIRNPEKRILTAINFWNQANVIDEKYKHRYAPDNLLKGGRVKKYLASRGVTIDIPDTIREHRSLKHYPSESTFPAMVAKITNLNGDIMGVHRTYLAHIGDGKAPVETVKKTLGEVAGNSIKLAPAGKILLITEGIENGLIAMQSTGLPVWVAMFAGNIPNLELPPPPGIEDVIIVADNDQNDIGIEMARRAAERWYRRYRRIRICMPPEIGSDINDYFLWDMP